MRGLEKFFSPAQRGALEAYVGPVSESGITTGQVETLLGAFLSRAYRRPVEETELENRFARIEGAASQADIVVRLKTELKAVLVSPGFLYRGLLMDGTPGRQSVRSIRTCRTIIVFYLERYARCRIDK